MSIPVLVLLGFAGWTILSLFLSVGIYRWSRILTKRSEISEFRADDIKGSDFYKRSMRAHANNFENLPLYAAIVIAIVATDMSSEVLDKLAITILVARIFHTSVHVAFVQTSKVVSIRFFLYCIQILCIIWMGIYIVSNV